MGASASATPKLASNTRTRGAKAAFLRLSNVAPYNTTDYAEVISGEGVPSGAYGRDSGATMLYLRTDAPTPAQVEYRTADGGTTWKPTGGLLYASAAASTAITGATETEAAFDTSYSLPANAPAAGSTYRIRGWGVHTATTGAETHQIAVKFGTATLAVKAAIDPANNEMFYFDIVVTIRTIGASGTLVAGGVLGVGASSSATAVVNIAASTTIDTTVANLIAAYIDRQATATDADSARLDMFVVEMVG